MSNYIAPKLLAAPNQRSLAICLVGSQQTYFQLRAAFLSLAPSSANGYYATVQHFTFCYFCVLLPAGSAAGSSAGIVFTHGPIFGVFAPQGRHVAPIKVKFGMEERIIGPLLHAKFHLDRSKGGVYGSQN